MIVPVGTVALQAILVSESGFARQVMGPIFSKIPGIVEKMINEYLDDEVTQLADRGH